MFVTACRRLNIENCPGDPDCPGKLPIYKRREVIAKEEEEEEEKEINGRKHAWSRINS